MRNTRKIAGKWIMALCLLAMSTACSVFNRQEYRQEPLTITQLIEKMDNEESFVLLAERDECPFCESLNEYIEQTKGSHNGLVVYTVDTTPFNLYREGGNAKTLSSDTNDGKDFLEIFPYFFYTPTLYQIRAGIVVNSGIGYNEADHTVSVWEVDSPVRFEIADAVNVWTFIEEGQ